MSDKGVTATGFLVAWARKIAALNFVLLWPIGADFVLKKTLPSGRGIHDPISSIHPHGRLTKRLQTAESAPLSAAPCAGRLSG
jgi:hypothetical protein